MTAHGDAWNGHPAFGRGGDVPKRSFGPVGLSMVEGTEILGPDDLPGHLVTVHEFMNADTAAAFVAGLNAAGMGNAMDCCWEHGKTTVNRIVFVAKFDEPKPEGSTLAETLPTVKHGATGLDGKAIANFHKEEGERNKIRWAEEARDREPVRSALAEGGFKTGDHGARWMRFGHADGRDWLTASWKDNSSVRLELEIGEVLQSSIDVTAEVRAAIESFGLTFEPDDRSIVAENVANADLARTADLMLEAERACRAARNAVWEEAFRASMKMTGPRRRFLAAGHEHGIHRYNRRNNERARAGAEDIGPSELSSMERMGWIASSGRLRMTVTEAGLDAAGIEVSTAPAP